MSAALWHVTLTLLNLLRHWLFTYLSKLMHFVLFKKVLVAHWWLNMQNTVYLRKKTYLVTPTNRSFTCISDEWHNIEYFVVLFMLEATLWCCLSFHCFVCLCRLCYMPSFQVSRQEEVGLFHGLQEVLIEYHSNFCVGLCKGHYVCQLCYNSVTGFSPWRSGFISKDNELIICRIYGTEW
jgi:hypothetical protein